MRRFHTKYGHGTILELITTSADEQAAVITFDNDPQTERTILLKFLTDSDAPIPQNARAPRKKPARKREHVSDSLLVADKETPDEAEGTQEDDPGDGGSLGTLKTTHCAHGYLIPTDIIEFSKTRTARDLVSSSAKVSPYCLDCWAISATAELFTSRFYTKPTRPDPCSYGYCDLISSIVNKRGFVRDSYSRESKKLDLRARLLEKKATIERAIAGKSPQFVENYIRKVLKNQLANEQTSSEGRVIANSVKSLTSDEDVRTDRKALAKKEAGDLLTSLTGGSSEDDDRSLDDKDTLVVRAPDEELSGPPAKTSVKREARRLFDTLAADASSQIATLTGGRKDGFDVHLDLEKALSRLPEDEQAAFSALYLENGQLLNRPRTYGEAEFLTSLSTQQVRTLERKAIEKLRPALSPAFFKRRSG